MLGTGRRTIHPRHPGRALGLTATMIVTFLIATPRQANAAATTGTAPHVQHDTIVSGRDVPRAASRSAPSPIKPFRAPAPAWPSAATVRVALGRSADAPATPVTLGQRRLDAAPAAPQPVRAGTTPIWLTTAGVGPDATGTAPLPVQLRLYDHATATRAGIDGLLFQLTRDDGTGEGATVDVGVDYSTLRGAYGADWASRLRLVELAGCATTTPVPTGCVETVLPTSRVLATDRLTASVSLPATAAPRSAAAHSSRVGSWRPAPGGVLLAAVAGASGGSGDFSATSLGPSGVWTVSENSGAFTWSYPITTPPSLGGPSPSLSLSYSSQTVDGEMAATNNQPSWVGEGFDFADAYIERSYRSCADDMGSGANNTVKTGDECWGTDNATLSMPGHAGELIKDGTNPNRWHLRNDDGSYVRHMTGAANGAQNGEWWIVTTTDGTQYWFGGTPAAHSTWTEPVYGNNSGEPCHQSTFAASSCTQAYRWNLDHVVDPSGNTMDYHYTVETNSYGADNNTNTLVSYVRGGYLTEIDYGTRTGGTGSAPMRVVFTTGNRCVTSSCGTHDATNWPDTPWDQQCTSTPCYNTSPTFWSTVMLNSVSTQLYSGTGTTYTNVNTWTLTHTFPDPGDGTRAGLWLSGITQIGQDGTPITLPAVTLTPVQLANRVEPNFGLSPMNWMRLAQITTESGERIEVTYSAPDCVSGSRMPDPNNLQNNPYRCFPVIWTPPGDTSPITDFFNKYVVTEVAGADLTTPGNPTTVMSYEYLGTPAWHYTDDDGIVAADTKTWSVWRGYGDVKEHAGVGAEETSTETIYFRGMNGDHLPSGTRSVSLPAVDLNNNGSVTDSVDVPAATDEDDYAGAVRRTTVTDGSTGAVISSHVNEPWESSPTATRTINGVTVYARFVGVQATHTQTMLDAGRAPRTSSTGTVYDSFGEPVQQLNNGDDAITGDEQCATFAYARNTTSDGSTWLVDFPSRQAVYSTDCAHVAAGGLTAADVISDQLVYYDGATTLGTAPTRGLPTRVDVLKDWVAGAPVYLTTSLTGYDANGRVTSSTDVRGNTTTTAYTTNAGGQLATTTTTTALGWVATLTEDPATGRPLHQVDANSRVTDYAYDGLGRATAEWQPGRDKATQSANVTFSYLVSNSAPTVVTTNTLTPSGGYRAAYDFYDGLLRPRQTQAPRADGTTGAIVTDTFYDTAGRVSTTNSPYLIAAAPGTGFFVANQQSDVPERADTSYDGAGRPVASTIYVNATGVPTVFSVTTTAYGGDHTDITPPAGGIATSTFTDANGHTTELRQYHGATPTPFTAGSYDSTTYTYNAKNQLVTVAYPGGAQRTSTYDVRGRKISVTDPNTGTSSTSYDDAGDPVSTTDGRGVTLVSTFDFLGRKTALYQGSVSLANELSSWTYDGLANSRGQLTSTTSYDNGNAYTTSVLGFTATYQPTGTVYTIPAAETGLAGAYIYANTYDVDGSTATTHLPSLDGGATPAETLTQQYSALGQPSSLSTNLPTATTLVPSIQYTGYGELGTMTLRFNGGPAAYYADSYATGTRRLAETQVSRQVLPPTISDEHYSYDQSGNLTESSDSVTGDNECYGYDYADRLTSAWTPAGGACTATKSVAALGGPAPFWTDWTFNAAGDRTTQVAHDTAAGVATTTYTVPAPGSTRPNTLTGLMVQDNSGTRTASFGYDAAGNTTSRPGVAGSANQTLTWNGQERLASDSDNGQNTSFVYDVGGNRLIRRDATGKTLYLPGQELRYTTASGTKTTTRYYTEAGLTVAMRSGGTLTWLLGDRQGTTNITIGTTAAQTVSVRYQDPYGNPRGAGAGPWPAAMDKGFLGGTEDPTGLTHLGLREYDPTIGRFISVDPVLNTADTKSVNGYGYADNNPVTFTDASGARPVFTDSSDDGGGGGGQDAEKWWLKYTFDHDDTVVLYQQMIIKKYSEWREDDSGHMYWWTPKVTIDVTTEHDPENRIPGTSTKGTGNVGKADIICWDCDPNTIYVWEVKHASADGKSGDELTKAPGQLKGYIDALRNDPNNKGKTIKPGPPMGPNSFTSRYNGGTVSTRDSTTVPGVIVYTNSKADDPDSQDPAQPVVNTNSDNQDDDNTNTNQPSNIFQLPTPSPSTAPTLTESNKAALTGATILLIGLIVLVCLA